MLSDNSIYLYASCFCPIIVPIGSTHVYVPSANINDRFQFVELLWVLEEMSVKNGKIDSPGYMCWDELKLLL